jgi:hypothetical protein
MHVGNGDTASKTEAIFFPAPRSNLPDVIDAAHSTERFYVLDDATGIAVFFIDFAKDVQISWFDNPPLLHLGC